MKINDLRLYLNEYLLRNGDIDIVFSVAGRDYGNFEITATHQKLYFDIDILNPIEDDNMFGLEI